MDTKYVAIIAGLTGLIAGAALRQSTIEQLQTTCANNRGAAEILLEEHRVLEADYEDLVSKYATLDTSYRELIQERDKLPLYDVPLSYDLQIYTYKVCEEYGVDYEMVLAVMWHESSFNAEAISASGDYGLMQINKCNHARLKRVLDIVDIMDPQSNIKAGVYMLSELYKNYSDTNEVLMAYNMGPGSASSLWCRGVKSTQYTTAVAEKYLLIHQNQYPDQNQ